MKYLTEYRDEKSVHKILALIKKETKNNWKIMEICGSQTHTIIGSGIDEMLPLKINLVHGPGCPVCVTPLEIIDKAIVLALREDVILCSYGDMMRVPGSEKDLLSVKAEGGDVRMVYSTMDVLKIARENPHKKIVFFAIGFETTTPANAMAVELAKKEKINNFYLLTSQVRVPPALEVILCSPECEIQGFLAPGHVCTVMGYTEYEPIAEKYKVPIVVTGFEPLDILEGIWNLISALETGNYGVFNQYKRAVKRQGNLYAKKLLNKIFEIKDHKWRGVGIIPQSGFFLKEEYRKYDANEIFKLKHISTKEREECIAGLILQGIKKPVDCPAYRKICTPLNPLGAPMVSSEGACAAYYNSGR